MALDLIAIKKVRLSQVWDPHRLQLKFHLDTIASHDQTKFLVHSPKIAI